MANSPPKDPEVEQTQSGEEGEGMDRQDEGAQQGLGDFEVKEQDRWLPIANGWSCFIPHVTSRPPRSMICCFPCVTYCLMA